jgi:hypothetical protein
MIYRGRGQPSRVKRQAQGHFGGFAWLRDWLSVLEITNWPSLKTRESALLTALLRINKFDVTQWLARPPTSER